MIPARQSSLWPRRHAVTLLEVTLVLCVLVTLAAMSWPALRRPMASQRLRTAADAVRAAWGRARIEAMSSGQTVLFQYAIDGEYYSVQHRTSEEFSSDPASAGALAGPGGQADGVATPHGPTRKLPKDVTFISGETTAGTSAEIIGLETEASAGGGLGWSETIVFYPDGTATDARLVLKNEYDRCIELSLRGFTGVVTVGDVYSAEENLP